MVVKNTKTSVNDKAEGRRGLFRLYDRFRMLPMAKRLILVFVVLLIMAASPLLISIINGYFSNDQATDDQSTSLKQEFLDSDDSSETKTKLVQEYGNKYDQLIADNAKSNPAQWTKQELDNAYAALLYAYKMGDTTQANKLVAYIDYASSSGMDIYDNSYNIDQSTYNSIKQSLGINRDKNTGANNNE